MRVNLLKLFSFAMCAILTSCLVIFAIRAKSNRTNGGERSQSPLTSIGSASTRADKLLQKADAMIARAPSDPDGYNLLCAAFMQRVRETGDFALTARAEAALNQSFSVAPDNYEAIKLKANLLLAYHRFGEALEVARRAQQLRPQDHEIYGALTDALVELGRYDEADEAVNQMMRLKPDSSSYARLSYLNFLHGETEGAIKVMRAAVQAATPQDAEGYAWYLAHLGDELLKAGRIAEAERQADSALQVFPDFHLALAAKARVRVAAGDLAGAVELYRRAQERVPLPDTAIALGDLYMEMGRVDEAKKQYELVEFIEQSGSSAASTYSRQLALFWANHDMKLDEALAIAQRERSARSDIYTCDTLAWCLFKKGNLPDAKQAVGEAMRLGTRDALIDYHAGMIFNALGDRRNAVKYLNLALKLYPTFDVLQADVARRTINAK